ncbi:MAG: NAD(P)/FAD-dependent oxidoreductase [Chloroflexi bacterium]|nr:NAD(P)/FAD-dependent oxidoreductase [Chloroflexota bacterium]
MKTEYDVIIVGGGPAGLFAALELSQSSNLRVLLLEKGKDIDGRRCPIQEKGGTCPPCDPCSMTSGLGGAGAFSDGKLTLSPQVGGRLQEYVGLEETQRLVDYVDSVYLKFGARDQVYGVGDEVDTLRHRASLAGLRLISVPIRHLGTERAREVLKAMRDHLANRVELGLRRAATRLLVDGGVATGVETDDGQSLRATSVIVAPGREGADWLVQQAHRLDLTLHNNPVDVGVRVEVPALVLEELTRVLFESKLIYYTRSFNDQVRTFCMCPHGEVTTESTGGSDPVTTVNGHSYADRQTENTNFALLVSISFTEPFREPIAYGRYLARLANLLGSGVLVQRLGDLVEGHRSTRERIERGRVIPTLPSATPGDLSFVLPYRHLTDIVEMLQAMDRLAPGVASPHTLLYGIEVKFYSARLELSPGLETEVANLYAAGDGAGVSRGLIQASASGVVAARQILSRQLIAKA